MKLSYFCNQVKINWAAVEELPSHLRRHGLDTEAIRVTFNKFPESIEMDSLTHLADYLERKGEPNSFWFSFRGTEAKQKEKFCYSMVQRWDDDEKHYYIETSLESENPEVILKSAMELLGLTPEVRKDKTIKELPRTVFIAHRFDTEGQEAADKVALFLTMLGFKCATGRGYAPGPISEKVKSRLQSQAVVVVIWTAGEDSTWLIQESLLSNLSGKQLMIIKEANSTIKPGLLADHEFIPFTSTRIEQAFIPLLEGLGAVGYQFEKQ